ncbi:MAG: sodium/solute symporter, partial [Planctomycetota bacterium]|nr:sodium/solute symporter [Planctomycetota bacterium]
MQALDRLDITMLVGYLTLTLVIGVIVGRRMRTGLDFFLAGRRLPWWAIGFSLVATDIGGTDIMGVGGATYNHGIAAGNFDWIGCVPVMIIAAFVFVPRFYRMKIYTIPEFMERRYNAAVRIALTLCWLLFMAFNMGIMLYASGKLLEPLLGLSQTQCIWLTAILVGLYTFTGGLAAVVYTDVLQCVVMIAGCLALLVMGINEVGGVEELHRRVRDVRERQIENERQAVVDAGGAESPTARVEHLDLVLPVNTRTPFPWTGIFFGLALILSPAYWIGNQAIIQRSLGAQSEFDAKAAYVWGALLKNLIPFIIAVPGLIAVVKFPELQDGDKAIPRLVAEM